jgi:phospholipase C
MLENRSFDCMLGQLYPADETFDGLTGTETNIWHKADGSEQAAPVWTDATPQPAHIFVPSPDPGELFTDIQQQIAGNPTRRSDGSASAMGGFVDNYMGQKVAPDDDDFDAVMHYFTPAHVPVLSQLARAFGVSDRWHASAPCQTWPNRLFVHTGTAGGRVNNTPADVPYMMETVFQRVAEAGRDWRIYFHDFPQTLTLGNLWFHPGGFSHFESFIDDAKAGRLPSYSFVEPRYFSDVAGSLLPNDQHPPHNVAYGEALIAKVYNAVRASPCWKQSLLIITYDEHGGCYDHVVPPAATSPGGPFPDHFEFDRFGVRVPAVIVSPYVTAGSKIRPEGRTPFDHTTVFKTMQDLFSLRTLTPRSDAAPSLLPAFSLTPDNDGPADVSSAAVPPDDQEVKDYDVRLQNGMQQSLSAAAARLPTSGANVDIHIQRAPLIPCIVDDQTPVRAAARNATSYVQAFLGDPATAVEMTPATSAAP